MSEEKVLVFSQTAKLPKNLQTAVEILQANGQKVIKNGYAPRQPKTIQDLVSRTNAWLVLIEGCYGPGDQAVIDYLNKLSAPQLYNYLDMTDLPLANKKSYPTEYQLQKPSDRRPESFSLAIATAHSRLHSFDPVIIIFAENFSQPMLELEFGNISEIVDKINPNEFFAHCLELKENSQALQTAIDQDYLPKNENVLPDDSGFDYLNEDEDARDFFDSLDVFNASKEEIDLMDD